MLQFILSYFLNSSDNMKCEDYLKSYSGRAVLTGMEDHMKTNVFINQSNI